MTFAPVIGFDTDTDCSHIALAAKAEGVKWIARYLHNLTVAEVKAILDAGIALVLIFETTAQRALLGAPAGADDARTALRQANALGAPQGVAIYATADFDETQAQDPPVTAYTRAFLTGLGGFYRLGFYGNGGVCELLLGLNLVQFTWLAGGSGMRDTKAFGASGRATIIQDVGDKRGLSASLGISIDSGAAYAADFGGWSAAAPQPAVIKPPLVPTPQPASPPAAPDGTLITVAEALNILRSAVHAYPDGAAQLQTVVGAAADGDIGKLTGAAIAAYLTA